MPYFLMNYPKTAQWGLALLTSIILTSCIVTPVKPSNQPSVYPISADGHAVEFRKHTLESYNRDTFALNDALDNLLYRPIASAYRNYTPALVQTGVGNFFNNLGDVSVTINDILQLKLLQAGSDFLRFLLNSTVGILGLFDLATLAGLEKHNEDLGQTLGYWGVGEGAYLLLPVIPFGMTLRDWTGFTVSNSYLNPESLLPDQTGITALKLTNLRASLLDREKNITGDRYSFIKDAYLQNRRYLVNDGKITAQDDFVNDDIELNLPDNQ